MSDRQIYHLFLLYLPLDIAFQSHIILGLGLIRRTVNQDEVGIGISEQGHSVLNHNHIVAIVFQGGFVTLRHFLIIEKHQETHRILVLAPPKDLLIQFSQSFLFQFGLVKLYLNNFLLQNRIRLSFIVTRLMLKFQLPKEALLKQIVVNIRRTTTDSHC